MKSLFNYYIFVLAPLIINYLLFRWDFDYSAILMLVVYVLVYRSYLDSLRLYSMGEISEDEHKKWYKRWYQITHFKKLYLTPSRDLKYKT